MVLTNKKLSVLAGVAGALLVTTVIVYSGGFFKPTSDFASGSMLIQGLDTQKIAKITVKKGDDTLTFKATERGFAMVERHGYLALMDKIDDLAVKCIDIRCDERITANKDNHKELGVDADSKEATFVTLSDKDDKVITGVVIGNPVSRGNGVYVRVIDKDVVYATDSWLSFSTDVTGYVDTDLLKIDKDKVAEITVTTEGKKDAACAVIRDEDGTVTLKGVPEGKQAKQSDLESLCDALSNVTFDDIASAATKPDTVFVCKTVDQLTYIVNVSKKDDKHYVTVVCGGPSDEAIAAITNPEDKQAAAEASEKARVFNDLHSNWVYEISSWSADKLRKTMSDLIEDIPAPKPDPPGGPEKVTASHVLIGYKGSSRSEATRTKAEARKLAEDILAKAKAPGADFAALAKEHSEGPSGKNGGDLGEFDKNTMHENFTKASFGLKVGDISGIVETPFGFHIIKRTK